MFKIPVKKLFSLNFPANTCWILRCWTFPYWVPEAVMSFFRAFSVVCCFFLSIFHCSAIFDCQILSCLLRSIFHCFAIFDCPACLVLWDLSPENCLLRVLSRSNYWKVKERLNKINQFIHSFIHIKHINGMVTLLTRKSVYFSKYSDEQSITKKLIKAHRINDWIAYLTPKITANSAKIYVIIESIVFASELKTISASLGFSTLSGWPLCSFEMFSKVAYNDTISGLS